MKKFFGVIHTIITVVLNIVNILVLALSGYGIIKFVKEISEKYDSRIKQDEIQRVVDATLNESYKKRKSRHHKNCNDLYGEALVDIVNEL